MTYFGPFPNLGGQNSEKPHDQIPRKHPDRQHKNGQTLFHRTIPSSADGPTSTTAVNRHLKIKDLECDVDLTKNYCITVSMRKIS